MHIGHCKALIMDFLTAEKYGGKCNLRFDDTNPAKEDTEYAEAIMRDIHWLGFDWTGGLYYASDYYDKLYEIAEDWIRRDLAYVDELSQEEMRAYRGTLTEPGKNSPWRDRPAEESLDLFHRIPVPSRSRPTARWRCWRNTSRGTRCCSCWRAACWTGTRRKR